MTGNAEGPSGSWDYGTVAYDAATGAQLWARLYDGLGQDDDPYDLAVSPDGSRVFVTGLTTVAEARYNWATVAYEA